MTCSMRALSHIYITKFQFVPLVELMQRKWVFVTNNNFKTYISLQSDVMAKKKFLLYMFFLLNLYVNLFLCFQRRRKKISFINSCRASKHLRCTFSTANLTYKNTQEERMKSRLELYLKMYDSMLCFIIGLHKKKAAEIFAASRG